MRESLQANKYQDGSGLIAETSPSLGKLGAANLHSIPEHLGNERFLKDSFYLAAVDACHCSSLIQKLAAYGQRGI